MFCRKHHKAIHVYFYTAICITPYLVYKKRIINNETISAWKDQLQILKNKYSTGVQLRWWHWHWTRFLDVLFCTPGVLNDQYINMNGMKKYYSLQRSTVQYSKHGTKISKYIFHRSWRIHTACSKSLDMPIDISMSLGSIQRDSQTAARHFSSLW